MRWLALGLALAGGLTQIGCPSTPLQAVGDDAASGEGGGGGTTGGSGKAGGRTEGGTRAAGGAGSRNAGSESGAPTDMPAEVLAGWIEQPLFDGRFHVYVPSAREFLPPPLAWEPCALPGPDIPKSACRQLAINWETDGANAVGGLTYAHVEPDGTVVLQLRHIYEQASTGRIAAMALVAPADGEVRQALFSSFVPHDKPGLVIGQSGLAKGKASWFAIEWGIGRYGALAGYDNELAPRELFAPDGVRGGARAGDHWLVETTSDGVFHITDWDTGEWVETALEDGASANVPQFAGDTLYFSYGQVALVVWTKETGVVALRTFADPDSAGGSLGTDGTDMVWLEGAHRLNPNEATFDPKYETRSIYTAPFTTDPQELKPRRLRSWAGTLLGSVYPPAVGCGRAMFIDDSDPDKPLVLVRLKDGVSWRLRSDAKAIVHDKWGLTVALSCTELFVNFGDNLARIDLSQLGPGEQPD